MLKPTRRPVKKTHSMRGAMLISMWSLILLIVAAFFVMTFSTRLIPSLNEVSMRTLYNHASGHVSRLSSEMNLLSRTARQYADELQGYYQEELGLLLEDLEKMRGDVAAIDALLTPALERVQTVLDDISATGAFVMLNTSYTDASNMAAVYLRDPSPGTGTSPDTSLTLLRGHVRLSRQYRPSLEKGWSLEHSLTNGLDQLFIEKPQFAARQYPKADPRDWGYWSKPLNQFDDGSQVILFTTPLLDGQGRPIGVLGLEVSLRYLNSLLPQENLPFEDSFYLIGQVVDQSLAGSTAFSPNAEGMRFLLEHPSQTALTLNRSTAEYTIYTTPGLERYVGMATLGLYGRNSPFLTEQYYLLAMAPREQVLANSHAIAYGMLGAVALAMVVALFATWFLSRYFAGRIEGLANEVRNVDPEQPVALSVTGIQEIDALSSVIEQMSTMVTQYSARMSTIVDLVGMQMGAFEINTSQQTIVLSKSLFPLLNLAPGHGNSTTLPLQAVLKVLPGIVFPDVDDLPMEMELKAPNAQHQAERWFCVRSVRQGDRIYGTIMDITEEAKHRKWLEFERDYDPLTRLLNRNAYPIEMAKRIAKNKARMGALIFADLDNLKYINDNFGHDMGDRYIQHTANVLKLFEQYGGVVARIAGDEFVVYLHGYGSRDELRAVIDDTVHEIRSSTIALPNNQKQPVEMSVGIAYYPDDAQDIETLIKYADFAMYEIKHTLKGRTGEFNKTRYDKGGMTTIRPNYLDIMIEGRRLRFAFQPILNVRTGAIYGYEALMRPQMRELHSPLEVLSMAKSQEKLNKIELLTLGCAVDWLRLHQEELGNRMLFVNVLANQTISEEHSQALKTLLSQPSSPLVLEFSEKATEGESKIHQKIQVFGRDRFQVALENDGSSNGSTLLSFTPNYTKVDMSLVRDIHTDPKRQALIRQIVSTARAQGTQVIAEGVETLEELETVIMLGVDHVQGFYIGRPEFELDQHEPEVCAKAKELYQRYHRGCGGDGGNGGALPHTPPGK